MSELILKSVYELLDKNYFIPSYQRGYRWGKRQVQDLLDDLYEFAMKDKLKDSFYCLQPIVVKQCGDNTVSGNALQSDLDSNIWYEVIDGQQRLTTIYLLFKYLINTEHVDMITDYTKNLFRISYQTHINDGNCINEPNVLSNVSPNAYYITQGYKNIADWFASLPTTKGKQQVKTIRGAFLDLLTGTKGESGAHGYVQVIWYNTDDDDPIKTFTRLNIGKIPLKNAELIKALFLQKRDDDKISEVQQIQIAKEWDQIEATLQNDRVWAFLNKDMPNTPARIEYIFDVIFKVDREKKILEYGEVEHSKTSEASTLNQRKSKKKSEDEKRELGQMKFEELYGTDEFASFRYFSELFENASRETVDKEWGRVREYYETFLEWYHNPLWYHYIGFLIYCGKPILEIFKLHQDKSKKEFEDSLVAIIRDHIKIKLKVFADGSENITTEAGDLIVYDNKTKDKLRQLLLLYNIEYIIQKNKGLDTGYLLFPFDLFKSEKWDIEHVDSYTTNPLTSEEQQIEWLKTVLNDLKDFGIEYSTTEKITSQEKESIEKFLNKDKDGVKFEQIIVIVSKLAGEELLTEEVKKDIKNTIGNLTLLNVDINRGYGNAIFPSKKKEIVKKDAEGRFIPICTKNVFLKNFIGVNNTSVSWREKDMEMYQKNIIDVIKKFLIVGEQGENK